MISAEGGVKILFIGCVESSYRLLEALICSGSNVCGVITKDHSDFNADFCDITPICRKYNIPFQVVTSINDEDSEDFIRSLSPDIGFCFGWSQLVKEEIINLFPKGMVGYHPAELPNNRGRHPLIWALALGLKETASTYFMMTAGADEGDILSQQKVIIDYEDDAGSLYDKMISIATDQEIRLVDALEGGTTERVPQDQSIGNAWRKRIKADGEIDWRMSSRGIYNLVRALTKPYVGAHFVYAGRDYKVWKVREELVEGMENMEPGKVLSTDGGILVKSGEGAIRLLEHDSIVIIEGDYLI